MYKTLPIISPNRICISATGAKAHKRLTTHNLACVNARQLSGNYKDPDPRDYTHRKTHQPCV